MHRAEANKTGAQLLVGPMVKHIIGAGADQAMAVQSTVDELPLYSRRHVLQTART